jgi:hypothetical protein
VTAPRDPWADPATETRDGDPYAGPPATGPAGPPAWAQGQAWQYGQTAGYGAGPGWPAPSYPGYPAWGWGPPPRPRRPGQVIAAAVLAFVQVGLVLFASLYLYLIVSVVGFVEDRAGMAPVGSAALVAEGNVLLGVQLASVVLLVVAGVLALNRRRRSSWWTLVAAHAVQVALAVYWVLRLSTLSDTGAGQPLAAFALFFLAGPAVAVGLLVAGPGRRWFDGPADPAGATAGPHLGRDAT